MFVGTEASQWRPPQTRLGQPQLTQLSVFVGMKDRSADVRTVKMFTFMEQDQVRMELYNAVVGKV